MVAEAKAENLEIMAAFENEFYLLRRGPDGIAPADETVFGSLVAMISNQPVIDEIAAELTAQGISVEQYYPELGWGQQELSIRHAPALRAADQQVLYRETVRGVARRHGLHASFAPKPWPDQPGNGCHLHVSALDAAGELHRFHDPAARGGLGETGRHFAAGLLEHLPALVALTCASVNSYRRLVPRSWASAYRVWGLDNREAAVRVPSAFRGREAASTNLELKPSDGSANPHLGLGGVIAAGLDGVRRRLEPPPLVDVDPSTLDDEERARVGAERLPTSLAEALDRLSQDEVLLDSLGDRLAGCYLAVKRDDIEAFAAEVPDDEFRQHRLRY